MAAFANSKELVEIMVSLWEQIKADPSMSEQLLRSKLIVQFRYRDPEGILTIDCSNGKDFQIIPGPGDNKPIVEMSMKADVAHDFWLGRLSIPVALLTGKIVSKGPTPKALSLLPVIRPAFALYAAILEKQGKKVLIKITRLIQRS